MCLELYPAPGNSIFPTTTDAADNKQRRARNKDKKQPATRDRTPKVTALLGPRATQALGKDYLALRHICCDSSIHARPFERLTPPPRSPPSSPAPPLTPSPRFCLFRRLGFHFCFAKTLASADGAALVVASPSTKTSTSSATSSDGAGGFPAGDCQEAVLLTGQRAGVWIALARQWQWRA